MLLNLSLTVYTKDGVTAHVSTKEELEKKCRVARSVFVELVVKVIRPGYYVHTGGNGSGLSANGVWLYKS